MSAVAHDWPVDDSGAEFAGELPASAIALVPPAFARAHGVVPWRNESGELVLLTSNAAQAGSAEAANELGFALGVVVRFSLTPPEVLNAALARSYPEAGSVRSAGPAKTMAESPGRISQSSQSAAETDAAVITMVDNHLAEGVRRRASDIHFEPFESEFKIRYRIDGVLHEAAAPTAAMGGAVSSRLKVMAGLDIAERRSAQDGRIRLAIDGREIDFRVSTLPTLFGESVVLRVLDAAAVQLDLRQLGMRSDVLAGVRDVIRRPHGIFVVTGPTGSGKTTTLYSCLRALNAPDVKILTVEDPVEYELEGIMQVGVNPVAGLTFATALRSFLRQDPDVIMVGEIRDLETAQIAIQAALTGHLVLTTLHTNDAVGAVTRLLDLGVEPYLLASTLEGVLAQRLVRRRCWHCERSASGPTRAQTCPECGGTGFHGRLGIYELLAVTEDMRELMTRRAPAEQIRDHAFQGGMRLLAVDADDAVREGLTTAEEVLKHL